MSNISNNSNNQRLAIWLRTKADRLGELNEGHSDYWKQVNYNRAADSIEVHPETITVDNIDEKMSVLAGVGKTIVKMIKQHLVVI